MTESSLAHVLKFVVPRDIADSVHEHLRHAGEQQCEGVGFWAGILEGDAALVTASIVPAQVSGVVGGGLAVVVSGDELFRMNRWLHENGLRLLAQVHSHPGRAYHSETDDDLAIATQAGALSIVVPDFAEAPFSVSSAAVFRRGANGSWITLRASEALALIEIRD